MTLLFLRVVATMKNMMDRKEAMILEVWSSSM